MSSMSADPLLQPYERHERQVTLNQQIAEGSQVIALTLAQVAPARPA